MQLRTRLLSGVATAITCALALLLSTFAASAHATGKGQQVYWAGYAFTGDQASMAATAPHSARVLNAVGLETINQVLSRNLRQQPPKYIELIEDPVAMLDGSTSATVLAAALDRELVSVEPIGHQYKLLVEVAFQALFFDFRERQVIASLPITLQRIDLRDTRPVDTEIDAIVAELLTGGSAKNLPRVLADALESARLPDASMRRLQVIDVRLSEAVVAKLPAENWRTLLPPALAHELSKAIAANTGIALLPPSAGQAIGGAMSARFADGRVYQLKIPEPDYTIALSIDALKEGVISETPALKTWLFGAFFTINVREPLSGKVYFDQPLRKGASKVVPATQTEVDLWSARYETLLAGLDAFAGAAAGRPESSKWLDEQKPGGRALQQQTKSLQELIQSCR